MVFENILAILIRVCLDGFFYGWRTDRKMDIVYEKNNLVLFFKSFKFIFFVRVFLFFGDRLDKDLYLYILIVEFFE